MYWIHKGKKSLRRRNHSKESGKGLGDRVSQSPFFKNPLSVTMSLFSCWFWLEKKIGQPSVIGDNRNWYYDTSLLSPLFPWSFVSCGVLGNLKF
jgi:hypothetical protein